MKRITFVASLILASLLSSCGDGPAVSTRYLMSAYDFQSGSKEIIYTNSTTGATITISPDSTSGYISEQGGIETVTRYINIIFANPDGQSVSITAEATYNFDLNTLETTQEADLVATINPTAESYEIGEVIYFPNYEANEEIVVTCTMEYAASTGSITLTGSTGDEYGISNGTIKVNLH